MKQVVTRAEWVRLKRAAEKRNLRLTKSRARILGDSDRGGFQLLDTLGRAIVGHRFDASPEEIAQHIYGAPIKKAAVTGGAQ